MKILIVTFTGGVNPGTIMQAIGVQTAFKQLYPNAHIEFLDFRILKEVNYLLGGKMIHYGIHFYRKRLLHFV